MKSLPSVQQHDLMDCGAAAIAIVCKFFGHPTEYRWIRHHLQISPDGASLHDLALLCQEIGLNLEPVSLETTDGAGVLLLCSSAPARQHGYGHFVVARPLNESKWEISDPASGVAIVPVNSLKDRFERIGLNFPIPENSTPWSVAPRKMATSSELPAIFKRFLPGASLLAGMTLLTSFLGIAPSFIFGRLVDAVTIGRQEPIGWLLAGYCACTALRGLLGLTSHYWSMRLGQLFSMRMSGTLIRKIIHLPWTSFASRRYGDYTTRMGAISEFQDVANEVIQSVFGRTFTLALSALALWTIHWRLLGVAAVLGVLVLLVNLISAKLKANMNYQLAIQAAGSGSSLHELLGLKRWINMNDASAYFLRRWSRLTKRLGKLNTKLFTHMVRYSSISVLIGAAVEIASISWAITLLRSGTITPGQLVTAISLMASMISVLGSFESLQLSARNSRLAYERLLDLFMELPGTPSRTSTRPIRLARPAEQILNVKLIDVTFGYRGETGPLALRNASITISRGNISLIQGPSGSGKSSLLGVLSGALFPFSGSLWITDSVGERAVDWSELRKLKICTFVDQEYRFFEGSILENLTLGRNVPPQRIHALLETAGLDAPISAFPLGIRSEITDAARGFSGGQLQRLSVVRALLSDKPLVIMDEPTSALDAESEARICDLILSEREQRIFAISSHSPALLRIADRAYKLESGVLT